MSGADQSWSEQRHKASLADQKDPGGAGNASYKSVQRWGSYDFAGMNPSQRRDYVADMLTRVREEMNSGNTAMALSTAGVVISNIVSNGALNNTGSNNANTGSWAPSLKPENDQQSAAQLNSSASSEPQQKSGVNAIQFLRLLLLQAECYSRLKNHSKACEAAVEAIRRGGYNSAQAHFIAARELFLLSEIERSVDMFVRAESLLESRVPEHEDSNTLDEAWAAVGIDPRMAPKGSNPREYFKEDYMLSFPNTAITKDDNGISIAAATPSALNNSVSSGVAGLGIGSGNFHPSVYEWAGELPSYRGYKAQAETLFKLLQSRCIPNSLESTNAVARYVRRHMASTATATPSSPSTLPPPSSASFGGPPQSAAAGRRGPSSESSTLPGGLCIIVKNFTETNVAMFCSTLEQGSEWDTLFRPPNAVPPNHLGACVVRQHKTNKNGPLSGILGFKVDDAANVLLRFGASNINSISQVVGVGSTTSANFSLPAINSPSSAESGVFVAPSATSGTDNAVWRLSAQGTIDTSTSILACPSVPAHWFAQSPSDGAPSSPDRSQKQAGYIANCRSTKHKVVFGPISYLCSPQNNGKVFQICAQRPHLATPNVLIFTIQEHRDPSNRLNELDLTGVFEFLHPDHRYKVACVNRSCRSLLAALPPTGAYYDPSIVSEAVMVDPSLAPSETVGPIFRSLYPAYALHRDYFDNQFIVRDKGSVTFDFGLEKPANGSSGTQHLLAFDPSSDTLLFHFLISAGTVTTERYLFYGPRRRTLLLQMSENTIWGLFSKKAAIVYAAGGPYASSGGSNRMTIGRIEPGPENSFNFVATYDKPELSTDPILVRNNREANNNNGNPSAVVPSTTKILFRVQRRMVPGTKIIEQIVVTRGPDFPADMLPAHLQRQRLMQQLTGLGNANIGGTTPRGLTGRYGNSATSSLTSNPTVKVTKDTAMKPIPNPNAFFAGPNSLLNDANGVSYDRCKRAPTAVINANTVAATTGGGGSNGSSAAQSPSKQPIQQGSVVLEGSTKTGPPTIPPAHTRRASKPPVEYHDFVARYVRPLSMGAYSKQHANSSNTSKLGDFVVAEGSDALLSFMLVAYAYEQWTN